MNVLEKIDARLIVRELKQILVENLGDIVSDVILYGSQLTGKAHENSDVDVLIILNTDYDWKKKREISDLCYQIDLKYDVFLDTQIISVNELKNSIRGKHPIFTNAIVEGYHA